MRLRLLAHGRNATVDDGQATVRHVAAVVHREQRRVTNEPGSHRMVRQDGNQAALGRLTALFTNAARSLICARRANDVRATGFDTAQTAVLRVGAERRPGLGA
jgi:hypothetical protein